MATKQQIEDFKQAIVWKKFTEHPITQRKGRVFKKNTKGCNTKMLTEYFEKNYETIVAQINREDPGYFQFQLKERGLKMRTLDLLMGWTQSFAIFLDGCYKKLA